MPAAFEGAPRARPALRAEGMMPAKQVLVIAYYFPPMGLSGVQRVAGFVRHLPAYGWQPVVLTTIPAGYFAYDESLLSPLEAEGIEIHRTRSLDPTRLFRRRQVVSMPGEATRRRAASVSQWLFIPDNKIGWMPFVLGKARRLIQKVPFDAIFSSAPPYTTHLTGARLSRRFSVPLVVDFRDDWVGNPRHTYPTGIHLGLHRRMEQQVMKQCSAAITINSHIRDALRERNPHANASLGVIPHGYEPAPNQEDARGDGNGKLQLLYTGVFYDAQTPDFFLRGVHRFLEHNREAKLDIVFAGLLPERSMRLVRELILSDVVRHLGYLSHDEVVVLQQQADVLWMTIGTRPGSSGISTGKIFEYMGRQKPILALVPRGTARDALRKYQASFIADPEDVAGIARTLESIYHCWMTKELPVPNETFVQSFSQKRLTSRLAQILGSCVGTGAIRTAKATA